MEGAAVKNRLNPFFAPANIALVAFALSTTFANAGPDLGGANITCTADGAHGTTIATCKNAADFYRDQLAHYTAAHRKNPNFERPDDYNRNIYYYERALADVNSVIVKLKSAPAQPPAPDLIHHSTYVWPQLGRRETNPI
jgi:hypothetical protein